ncbi:hypothetical protein [Lysobacter fragariae]
MINQGECPKCGKRLLHVRIESVFGESGGVSDVRCLSFSCIHCNTVVSVQLDPRNKPRTRRKTGAEERTT